MYTMSTSTFHVRAAMPVKAGVNLARCYRNALVERPIIDRLRDQVSVSVSLGEG